MSVLRESAIEDYLCNRVRVAGGEVRKVKWIGRKSAPDRLVMLNGRNAMIELKRPGEEPRGDQVREHEKMRRVGGFDVRVIDNKTAVDSLVDQMTH